MSETKTVAQAAPGPDSAAKPIRDIVVGYDGSDASARACSIAVRIAGLLGARIHLVHAGELRPEIVEPRTEEEIASVHHSVAAAMELVRSYSERVGVPLRVISREGSPATAILAVQEETGADLILVGTRGLHAAPRLFLGSVSADVLARSRVPVTIVP
ncbi:UspA domain protein [mine drainage metagenome]|uniref:UspA domain protein n=1 Tax=mine drainage metagenome TaxID=410659 RepID=T1BH98_9ZZZZ